MSFQSRMFVFLGVALAAPGCTSRHILQLSSPERASTVTLVDQGQETGPEDDTVVVLEDPARITKVAAFFEARTKKWQPMIGKPATVRRNQIKFRHGNEVTDWFWIENNYLCLSTPAGACYTCKLSDAERTELLNLFADSSDAPASPTRG